MADNNKDTIYIDIDDEITGIIDKMRGAKSDIAALVLPKRSTVFQSIVNMKLLKKSADEAGKRVVLVTSQHDLLPLAGATGLYVARTLNSPPEIPAAPRALTAAAEPDQPDDVLTFDNTTSADAKDFNAEAAATTPVGELASSEPAPVKSLGGVETLELDNTEPSPVNDPADKADDKPKKYSPAGKPKDKKVPNFFRFRKRLIIGGLVILLLIFLYFLCFHILPSATVDVKTNAQAVPTTVNMTLDSNANSLDAAHNIVPATVQQEQKSYSESAPATGQKDEGTKASGSLTMSEPCSATEPASVPAGTGVSAGGLTFITQQTVGFNPSVDNSGNCSWSGSTGIVAQNNGSQYNLGPRSDFTVAGRPELSASSNGESGGTSKIVKVVQASDIEAAKSKISKESGSAVKQDLENKLQAAGLYAIPATFNDGTPQVNTSQQAGDQASSVTVNETITYSLFGVKKSYLRTLVNQAVGAQINTKKQSILDEGVNSANFKVISASATSDEVSMSTNATVGPDLNVNSLKQQIEGKKAGDIKSIISNNPGVTGVDVNFSPPWVGSAPNNPGKITIKFAKPAPPKNGG